MVKKKNEVFEREREGFLSERKVSEGNAFSEWLFGEHKTLAREYKRVDLLFFLPPHLFPPLCPCSKGLCKTTCLSWTFYFSFFPPMSIAFEKSFIYLFISWHTICFPFVFCNICINVIQWDILLISNYSVHRITDNLLAMARPSTEIMEKFNIIEQFHMYVELSSKLPVSDSQDAPGMTLLMLNLTSF